jgi:hypothetical protein
MDMNVYLIEWWAKERLGEIRSAVEREQLVESIRRRSPLRAVLGQALISIGRKLQGRDARVGASARTSPA